MKSELRVHILDEWQYRRIGRAKNAMLNFLERKLSVPKIYIDATWDGQKVEALAIDRDGVGDVHVVKLVPVDIPEDSSFMLSYITKMIEPLVAEFRSVPAQYKYIAPVDVSANGRNPFPGVPHSIAESSFSEDGIGRVGFVAVDFLTDEEPQARIIVKPERFRAKVFKLADDYIEHHTADWEIRA